MTRSPSPAADRIRNREIGVIHAGKKALGIEDGDYRAMLQLVTGKDSAAKLNATERQAVIEHLRQKGFRRKGAKSGTTAGAEPDHVRKLRALWLSLHNLGEVRDASDDAMAAFVRGQVHVDALRWLTAAQANTVIEALKAWLRRAGVQTSFAEAELLEVRNLRHYGDRAPVDAGVMAAKVALLRGQWARLKALGAFTHAGDGHADLGFWLGGATRLHPALLDLDVADAKAAALGKWIRRLQKKGD